MAEGRKQTKKVLGTARVGLSSSRSACQACATPHCPTPCPPSIRPCRTLPLGNDKPNRARRTPQIPGSQPEQALGVMNLIRNLEALSEPQATSAMGGLGLEYRYPGGPMAGPMASEPPNPPAVAAGPCRRPPMCQHERKRGGWCGYSHGAWGGKGGWVGWARLDGSGRYSACLSISARGESLRNDFLKCGLIRPRPASADSG